MNNKLEVIGIDHGWSMMKTVTQVFVTGVKEITTTPALFGDVLEYDGKYYKIGTVRQEVKDTKVEDDSFYLLTLAAVAKELKKRGLSDAKVFLAVGLPLTRFGAERNNFIKYLTKNKRVDFRYENEAYHIEIDDVAVFPQCYGRLVGAINCQVDTAFEQMKETKRNFGKIDKRQGYHIILSFKENEVNPDTAFEITQKFVEEYLGKSYEAVFVVHDNTAHVHSHIVFNSVSFVDGKKYRYEKGDWAKYIQPITNRLCQEYGLSIIDVDDEKKERQHESYKEWSEYREGNFVWPDMIKRDLDACILQAKDYEEFLELLSEKGYQIKQGKHLAIKPQGMTRFRRCKSLGDMYCEEAIRDRIVKEDIAFYKSKQDIPKVSIVKCRVKRYRRAGLSGLQKKHYAKLYRVGKLKKRPYSQVWKYREDIRKMHKLQEQYLFLARHNIHSAEELVGTIASLTDKKKETSAEKSRIYKARERSRELFTAADEMENLKPAEQSYRLGDTFFEDEHRKWVALEQELQAQGYSLEEVQALRRHYKEEYSEVCAKEKVVFRELNTGKAILNSMIPDSISDGRKTEYNREIIRDRKEQPVR